MMSNTWWIIAVAGLGTYLMRSVGVWVETKSLKARWLNHVPFVVILAMTVSSLFSLSGTLQELLAAIASSAIVITVSMKKLPLVLCVAIGCVVFGTLAGR